MTKPNDTLRKIRFNIFSILMLAALTTCFGAAFSVDRSNPEELVRQADELYDKKEYAKAIEITRRVVQEFPNSDWDAKASQILGLSHFARGENQPAIDAWKRTAQLEKNSTLGFRAKMNIALALTQMKRAKEGYEAIFDISPGDLKKQGEEEQKRYFLLSAMIVNSLGKSEIAAEIFAVNYARFNDADSRIRFLDGVEEAVRKFTKREDVDKLLAKDLKPEVRRRIQSTAQKVPALRVEGYVEESETETWDGLRGLHDFAATIGLAGYYYSDRTMAAGIRSLSLKGSTAIDLGDAFSLEPEAALYALSIGLDRGQTPRLFRFEMDFAKAVKTSEASALSFRLGGHYTTLLVNVPAYLKSQFGPRAGVAFRHWIAKDMFLHLGVDFSFYKDGPKLVAFNCVQGKIRLAAYRSYAEGMKRIGFGLEAAGLQAKSQGLDVHSDLVDLFLSLQF